MAIFGGGFVVRTTQQAVGHSEKKKPTVFFSLSSPKVQPKKCERERKRHVSESCETMVFTFYAAQVRLRQNEIRCQRIYLPEISKNNNEEEDKTKSHLIFCFRYFRHAIDGRAKKKETKIQSAKA